MTKVAKIILPFALGKEFDYSFDPRLTLKEGMRVLVDFRGRKRLALVSAISSASEIKNLKPVLEVLDQQPLLNSQHIRFAQQLSRFYPYPFSEFLFMMLPAYLKRPKPLNLALPKEQKQAKGFSLKRLSPNVPLLKLTAF